MGLTKIEATTRSALPLARATSERWPSCSAPMVGTSAILSPAFRHGARLRLKSPTVRTAMVLIGTFSGGDHNGASPRVNCRGGGASPTSRARLPICDTALFTTDEGSIYIRSEEHTSELQSLRHLVCRLLLEKKK